MCFVDCFSVGVRSPTASKRGRRLYGGTVVPFQTATGWMVTMPLGVGGGVGLSCFWPCPSTAHARERGRFLSCRFSPTPCGRPASLRCLFSRRVCVSVFHLQWWWQSSETRTPSSERRKSSWWGSSGRKKRPSAPCWWVFVLVFCTRGRRAFFFFFFFPSCPSAGCAGKENKHGRPMVNARARRKGLLS